MVALAQHLITTWDSSRLRLYGHSSALIWRGAAPQRHTARSRAFLARAAAARAQLSHVSLPCLAGVAPHVLQRCVSVSFGPPHKMQRPNAARSACFVRFNALCSERQELQRIALVSVGMPHAMQSPEAARSALFALNGAFCFSRQEVQR